MILGSPLFVLDAPGRVGNLLAADLHRSIGLSAAPPSLWPGPFGRPAFFVAGPRVTEVSLSGITRRLNYSVFKVPCGLWQKPFTINRKRR